MITHGRTIWPCGAPNRVFSLESRAPRSIVDWRCADHDLLPCRGSPALGAMIRPLPPVSRYGGRTILNHSRSSQPRTRNWCRHDGSSTRSLVPGRCTPRNDPKSAEIDRIRCTRTGPCPHLFGNNFSAVMTTLGRIFCGEHYSRSPPRAQDAPTSVPAVTRSCREQPREDSPVRRSRRS